MIFFSVHVCGVLVISDLYCALQDLTAFSIQHYHPVYTAITCYESL